MALVAGLSFTGALFILFMSCARILDRQMEESLSNDLRRRRSAGEPFSVKAWKEEHGVDSATTERVLQALALLAPALTGALTLVATS